MSVCQSINQSINQSCTLVDVQLHSLGHGVNKLEHWPYRISVLGIRWHLIIDDILIDLLLTMLLTLQSWSQSFYNRCKWLQWLRASFSGSACDPYPHELSLFTWKSAKSSRRLHHSQLLGDDGGSRQVRGRYWGVITCEGFITVPTKPEML